MLTSSHSVKKNKKKTQKWCVGLGGWGEWEGVVDDPPLPEHAR